MSKKEFKELLGIGGILFSVSVDPFEVAAFMPEKHAFKKTDDGGELWRMRFLMKSGETICTDYMIERCFRSWKEILQKMFDYIHPGKIDDWVLENGFTGYLRKQGVSNKKMKKAEEKFSKTKKAKLKKNLFNK